MMTDSLHISPHPLTKHKLAILRSVQTDPVKFRQLVHELAILLAYEATGDLILRDTTVTTPLGDAPGSALSEAVGLVPILRSGLGMVEAVWGMVPVAEVWHIGLYRDEHSLRPVEYYNRLPPNPRIQVCLILDPMLATGGSAVAAVEILKRWGVPRIKFVGLIGAPEGIARLSQAHPEVPIHLAAVDDRLNDSGFIVPGLGDAGDRQFGTTP
jgi:uracil phosphoribosyltransferase